MLKKPKKPKTRKLLKQAFSEVKHNVPDVVKRTARKKGKAAAKRQMKAIALSKARRKGARIPKK